MENPPEYLKPVIGFALWHIQNGADSTECIDRINAKTEYGQLSKEDVDMAVKYALASDILTAMLRTKVEQLLQRQRQDNGYLPNGCNADPDHIFKEDCDCLQSNRHQSAKLSLLELLSLLAKGSE